MENKKGELTNVSFKKRSVSKKTLFRKKLAKKVNGKKGELTTQQLVVIIILILSFTVILFLLFRLNLGETTNKELCHNSVVLAGKGSGFVGELDCTTTYVCISNGENCEDFSETINVEVKTEEETIEAIQQEIDDCWWMFGEGKINYVGSVSLPGYRCAICSVIKFEGIEDFEFNGVLIDSSKKYSVVTGLDPTLPFVGDNYINATIIQNDDIGSLECKEFISKA